MRGKVLHFSDVDAVGSISADDGVRYSFTRGDLQGGLRSVVAGSDVDFQVENGAARSLYVVSQPAFAGDKNKYVAALLAFFLGLFGAHKFYLGRTGPAIVLLLCGTLGWLLFAIPPAIAAVICLIETIIYVSKSDIQFNEEYVVRKKSWF